MFDPTLHGLISQLEARRVVLPAMQRPLVWNETRIIRLVDSLLRGFPLGAVMLWKSKIVQRYRPFQKNVRTEEAEVFQFELGGVDEDRYLVLDGQQRLTALLVASCGTYNGKRFYLNVLSGKTEDKDPGDEYYEGQFLTAKEASSLNSISGTLPQHYFLPFGDLVNINPPSAGILAVRKGQELGLSEVETERLGDLYIRAASVMGNRKALQVIFIGENPGDETSVDEVLEIFVRVNSGGLVLQKSDLLMSLLDLHWNDIQPELMNAVREINVGRPYRFTRDDLLKSLLLLLGSETRFDRLVVDRGRVAKLASTMEPILPGVRDAWRLLAIILNDDCKIYSERFFRGGHNALLPFVVWLYRNPRPTRDQRRELTIGIYVALMSGVFSSAEARMGRFTGEHIQSSGDFPLNKLGELVKWYTAATSFETLCARHLDLALNIAHGGISLDNNPENLQRDHIFPRSTLEAEGKPGDLVHHYANFHFLRADDNLNKSDKPPHEWFQSPGAGAAPYSDQELDERLLDWDLLQPGKFEEMVEKRRSRIGCRAEQIFGRTIDAIDTIFA